MTMDFLEYCLKCGATCCKKKESPLVFPEERDRIVKETGKDFFKEMDGYYIIPNDPCPYLKGKTCSIHEIKPLHCKIFPVCIKLNGKAWLSISTECPATLHLNKEWIKLTMKEGKKLLNVDIAVIKKYMKIYGDAFETKVIK